MSVPSQHMNRFATFARFFSFGAIGAELRIL